MFGNTKMPGYLFELLFVHFHLHTLTMATERLSKHSFLVDLIFVVQSARPTSSQSPSALFNWLLSSMVNNTATATSARTITKSERKPHVIEPSTTDAPKGKQDEDECRKADAEKAKALKSLRAGIIGGIDALRPFCCRRRKGTTPKIAKQKKLTKIYDYDRNNNGIEQKWR